MKIENKPKVEQPKVAQPKQEQPKVEQPKVEQIEQPKVEQLTVEEQEIENQAKEIRVETWKEVQDVAQSEVTSNGKMLYIFKHFLELHEMGKLGIENYFDDSENDKTLNKILFDLDKKRKTLIAKDFDRFCNLVLIPSMGKNLKNFQVDYAYEYRVLQQVSPVVLFGLANRDKLDLDKMLIIPEKNTIPVEIELPWKLFKFDHLKGNEQVFRSNLVSRLFSESEKKKNLYCTFRGEKGLEYISRTFFLPKKVIADNVTNAEVSPFAKVLKDLNDTEKGDLGTAKHITEAKENTEGSKRRNNEIDELYFTAEKAIELLASSNCEYARKTLIDLYTDMLDILNADSFQNELKKISTAKVEFEPRVNGTSIDASMGDFFKYIKEVDKIA
jgi:hypothetical protein